MCIIYNGGLYDLGCGKDGTVITFADGKAWFTVDGQTCSIPVGEIDQIISFETNE